MTFRGTFQDKTIVFSFENLSGWDDGKVYVEGKVPLLEISDISVSVGKDKNGREIFNEDVLSTPFGIFKVIPITYYEKRGLVYCDGEGGKIGVYTEKAEVVGNEIDSPGLFRDESLKVSQSQKI